MDGLKIKGTVKDVTTGETVVGASVMVAEGKVAITDINGNYSIQVDSGSYTVTISYVGFEPQKQKVVVGSKPVSLNFSLETKNLSESPKPPFKDTSQPTEDVSKG